VLNCAEELSAAATEIQPDLYDLTLQFIADVETTEKQSRRPGLHDADRLKPVRDLLH
jgi:hypothetical protein